MGMHEQEISENEKPLKDEKCLFSDALSQVMQNVLIKGSLSRGAREVIKAIESQNALICLMSESCSETSLVALLEALCRKHHVDTLLIKDSAELGRMCWLQKKTSEKKRADKLNCACAAITDYGENCAGLETIR